LAPHLAVTIEGTTTYVTFEVGSVHEPKPNDTVHLTYTAATLQVAVQLYHN